VTFVVVTALPDLPEPTVDLVFPEMEEQLALRAPPEPMALRARRALMASQARMELLVDVALLERQALKAQPALRGRRAPKVDLETANV
jgi:hypothetical protein